MNFASFCEEEPFSGFIPSSNGGEHKKSSYIVSFCIK